MLVSETVSIGLGSPTESSQAVSVVHKEHREEIITAHVGGDVVPVMATWRRQMRIMFTARVIPLNETCLATCHAATRGFICCEKSCEERNDIGFYSPIAGKQPPRTHFVPAKSSSLK